MSVYYYNGKKEYFYRVVLQYIVSYYKKQFCFKVRQAHSMADLGDTPSSCWINSFTDSNGFFFIIGKNFTGNPVCATAPHTLLSMYVIKARPFKVTQLYLINISGRSRISPRWRRQPSRGRQHTILPKFPKNCMKLKEFGRGGGHVLRAPLRSATEYALARLKKCNPVYAPIADCCSPVHQGAQLLICLITFPGWLFDSTFAGNLRNRTNLMERS